MKIGDKVQLKENYAKWYLNHPEVYESAKGLDKEYWTETLLHLMCCFKIPIEGRVIDRSDEYFHVEFRHAKLRMDYWVCSSRVRRLK